MTVRIPLAKPEITDADREAVTEVLRTPYLSSGPKVAEFERAICDYTKAKHAVAVNSGTSALQLAIRALGIQHGSEVVLPSFTFSAVLNVILLECLRPKFVDIDPRTYNCSAEAMLAAVTDNTKLIIAVQTFGFPVDVTAIINGLSRRSRNEKAYVIEDACEALGAEVHGRKGGTLADAGLFAFYPNKQITNGEGGMLVTSHENIARKAAQLRNQGRDPALGWNSHAEIGFSYRISDINCALGISQLARIADVIAKRQQLAGTYDRELANISEVIRPPLRSNVGRISWFVYPVQLAADFSGSERDQICDAMRQKGIATGRYFAPLHRQPVLRQLPKLFTSEKTEVQRGKAPEESASKSSPNTEFIADRIIQLPFFNELTEREIREVCAALREALQDARRKT
jgi:perosamine synthetase